MVCGMHINVGFWLTGPLAGFQRQDMYDLGGMIIDADDKTQGSFPMNTSPPDNTMEATSGEWTKDRFVLVAPPQIQDTENQ